MKNNTTNTPYQDLKIMWAKYHRPKASWLQIEDILSEQFNLCLSPHSIKKRFDQFLDVPQVNRQYMRDQEATRKTYKFNQKSYKNPQDFIVKYKKIKEYHENPPRIGVEEKNQRQVLQCKLFPHSQQHIIKLRKKAINYFKQENLSQKMEQLRMQRKMNKLDDAQQKLLQKIEKYHSKITQMKAQNTKKMNLAYKLVHRKIQQKMQEKYCETKIDETNINQFLQMMVKDVYLDIQELLKTLSKKGIKTEFHLLEVKSFSVIEDAYTYYKKQPYQRNIIKLYYFNSLKENYHQNDVFQTRNLEQLTKERVITIMKYFKNLERAFNKIKQKQKNQIMSEIKDCNFMFEGDQSNKFRSQSNQQDQDQPFHRSIKIFNEQNKKIKIHKKTKFEGNKKQDLTRQKSLFYYFEKEKTNKIQQSNRQGSKNVFSSRQQKNQPTKSNQQQKMVKNGSCRFAFRSPFQQSQLQCLKSISKQMRENRKVQKKQEIFNIKQSQTDERGFKKSIISVLDAQINQQQAFQDKKTRKDGIKKKYFNKYIY